MASRSCATLPGDQGGAAEGNHGKDGNAVGLLLPLRGCMYCALEHGRGRTIERCIVGPKRTANVGAHAVARGVKREEFVVEPVGVGMEN